MLGVVRLRTKKASNHCPVPKGSGQRLLAFLFCHYKVGLESGAQPQAERNENRTTTALFVLSDEPDDKSRITELYTFLYTTRTGTR